MRTDPCALCGSLKAEETFEGYAVNVSKMEGGPSDVNKLIRRIETWNYLEIFLVSAVLAVLLIRLFLRCTHYPQLGGARFHIAHMLWGGLLMMAAIVSFFSFMGHEVLQFASVLGGLGFGTFIDEIGKFLTHDNNYFFQPSISLIYFIFILIFFTVRTLFHNKIFSQQEYFVNVIALVGEMANNGLDAEGKTRLLAYLQKCDPVNPLVGAVSEMIGRAAFRPHQEHFWISNAKSYFLENYKRIASSAVFETAIVAFFSAELAVTFFATVLLVFFPAFGFRQMIHIGMWGHIANEFERPSFLGWAEFISTWFSAFFVFAGIIMIRKKRLVAFHMFEHAILISILLTQFFAFYRAQLGALTGLFLNLIVWMCLRRAIAIEKLKESAANAGCP